MPENIFKGMRDEFALDVMTFWSLEAVGPEAKVVDPASRELGKALRRERLRLASFRSRIADARRRPSDLRSPKVAERRLEQREAEEAGLAARVEDFVAGDLLEGRHLDSFRKASDTSSN